MTSAYRKGLFGVLLCLGISILWGASIGRSRSAWVDFRAVYAGTRCLMHGHNPYSVSDLEREYLSEDGQRQTDSPFTLQTVTLYVNVPTTFVLVAPFAALPWGPAHVLWMLLTSIAFSAAVLLIWDAGARSALDASTLLACVLAADCESIFGGGNTGGVVVGFCVIAVWCLLSDRLVWLGVVCLGLSLAIKPHDAGFIWLFFLLIGGVYRKRALQSLCITAVIGLTALLWVSHVAPHWMHGWNANLTTISAPGGINEPSPNSVTGRLTVPVMDLQAAVSIFRDNPHFYNAVSYLVCGALLLVWVVWTLRSQFSQSSAWLGIAAASALTILITYHRQWDAKLVMLAIPPFCKLWAERGLSGKIAFWVTAAAIFFTADVPIAFFNSLYHSLHPADSVIAEQLRELLFLRSASVALLAMGIFYLWVYVRSASRSQTAAPVIQDLESVSK